MIIMNWLRVIMISFSLLTMDPIRINGPFDWHAGPHVALLCTRKSSSLKGYIIRIQTTNRRLRPALMISGLWYMGNQLLCVLWLSLLMLHHHDMYNIDFIDTYKTWLWPASWKLGWLACQLSAQPTACLNKSVIIVGSSCRGNLTTEFNFINQTFFHRGGEKEA